LSSEVDGEELEQIVSAYPAQVPTSGQEGVIALDGKTVCSTITQEDRFGLHLLAAHLPGQGIGLMQMAVEKDKGNEIVVARKFLNFLDLRKKAVLAMPCTLFPINCDCRGALCLDYQRQSGQHPKSHRAVIRT